MVLADSQEDATRYGAYPIKADDRYLSNIYTGSFPSEYLEVIGSQKVDNIFGTGTKFLKIDAGTGHDLIFGGDKGDIIVGGAGHEFLQGGADNDIIFGGSGDDVILGDEHIRFWQKQTGCYIN